MNIFDFTKFYAHKRANNDPCTAIGIHDKDNDKNLIRCTVSDNASSCYDYATNKYSNDLCSSENESCAAI